MLMSAVLLATVAAVMPVENTAIKRVRDRIEEKDRYIDVELQHKLRTQYINICKNNGGILVPTDIPIEQSYDIVKKEIERVIKNGYREQSV